MKNQKKRDTNSDYIGREGHRQVSGFFDGKGFLPSDILPDKGEDILVRIFDDGVFTGLSAFIQIKSSQNLDDYRLTSGDISYAIPSKDIEHWLACGNPVFIVTWDITKHAGHWIEVTESLVGELDERKSDWRTKDTVQICLPSQNLLNDDGVTAMRSLIKERFRPMFETRRFNIKLNLPFLNSEEGKEALHKIKRHRETGDPLILTGHEIKSVEFPDWWERQNGPVVPNEKSVLLINPASSDVNLPYRLKILSKDRKNKGVQNIELRLRKGGTKEAFFNNKHNPTPVAFNLFMRIEERGTYFESDYSMNGAKPTVKEALFSIPFLRAVSEGGIFQIENLKTGTVFESELAPTPEMYPDEELERLLTQAVNIQDRTGHVLHLPNWEMNRRNYQTFQDVALIITTGRIIDSHHEMTFTVSGPENEKHYLEFIKGMLDLNESEEKLAFSTDAKSMSIHLLDTEIPLGASTQHFTGQLTADSEAILQGLLLKPDVNAPVSMTLINVNIVSEFHEWTTV